MSGEHWWIRAWLRCLAQQKDEEILESLKYLARKFHLECIKKFSKNSLVFQECADWPYDCISRDISRIKDISVLSHPREKHSTENFSTSVHHVLFYFCLTFIRPRAKRYARDLPIIGASCPRSQINGKLASRRPRAQASNGCAIVIRITLSNDFDNCRH